MTTEDKRLIVESVGLCWHEEVDEDTCSCGWEVHPWGRMKEHIASLQLDPTDPTDMVKIWEAFKEEHHNSFIDWLDEKYQDLIIIGEILTETPQLAQAMLEYFKEADDAM